MLLFSLVVKWHSAMDIFIASPSSRLVNMRLRFEKNRNCDTKMLSWVPAALLAQCRFLSKSVVVSNPTTQAREKCFHTQGIKVPETVKIA